MLILFDIDATLIRTQGAGMLAMGDAGRELFGPEFACDGTSFAGRLDPLIVDDLLTSHGVAPTNANRAAFRAAYAKHLERRLDEASARQTLPGVLPLLEQLAQRAHVTLGLLTGNFPETGRAKLEACGVPFKQFAVAAWGDDSPHVPPSRDHLPPVAMQRYEELRGRRIEAERVTVIGDTPLDVQCARAHGCRSLGVATGQYSPALLLASGAHHAVEDLSNTPKVVGWLLGE